MTQLVGPCPRCGKEWRDCPCGKVDIVTGVPMVPVLTDEAIEQETARLEPASKSYHVAKYVKRVRDAAWKASFEAHQNRDNKLTCAHCGQEFPPGTPPSNHEALTAHGLSCPKSPLAEALRVAIAALKRLEFSMEGDDNMDLCPECWAYGGGHRTHAGRCGLAAALATIRAKTARMEGAS